MDYGAKTLTLILITVSVTFDFSNSHRKSAYILILSNRPSKRKIIVMLFVEKGLHSSEPA